MKLKYYYNSTNKEFVITNGICNAEGFVEIAEERYNELQEELAKSNEDNIENK